MVEIRNLDVNIEKKILYKKYNAILNDNIILLNGKNGSGKTTLLNIIYKNNNDYTGDIFINNKNIKQYKTRYYRRKIISYINQEIMLFNSLSVIDNLNILCINKKQKDKCINFLLKNTTINLKDKVSNLSGGQKQIINIVIGLFKEVDYYLIDEPFNNLSTKIISIVIEEIKLLKGLVIIVDHKNHMELESILNI